MAISFKKYVNITSGVAGASSVPQRELIARIISQNTLIPPDQIIEITTPDDVGNYFGFDSEEYKLSVQYFGFVSKQTTRPKMISFARWANGTVNPFIVGRRNGEALSKFKAIQAGEMTIKVGENTAEINGLNLSSATSMLGVANLVQVEILRNQGFSSSEVRWDAENQRFNFTFGQPVGDSVSVTAGDEPNDIAGILGWLDGATYGKGVAAAQSIQECLSVTTEISNNFGSFYILVADLTVEQIASAAAWNLAQNNLYMYSQEVTKEGASIIYEAVSGFGGIGLTIKETGEYQGVLPMSVLAATNYNSRAASQNYMFQQAALTPTVTTTTESDSLDSMRINYYGQTKTAGQGISFYQRGYLMGGSSDARDMQTYVNEIWLKDRAASEIMNALIALTQIPANNSGRATVIGIVTPVAEQALFNGVISVGKTLSSTQKIAITDLTGDPEAWRTVQDRGYYINARIEEIVNNGAPEFNAVYQLIYAKSDSIRSVDGSHTLI